MNLSSQFMLVNFCLIYSISPLTSHTCSIQVLSKESKIKTCYTTNILPNVKIKKMRQSYNTKNPHQ